MDAEGWVAISALQHVLFCERQAALIHVERVWVENQLTAVGRIIHERTDIRGRDKRKGLRVERAVRLAAESLKLLGVADCVEWVPGLAGAPRPKPVETKKGRESERLADRVQLCAQALCLEEMFACEVSEGVLFYAASRKRVTVSLDAQLRATTLRAVARMHELLQRGEVPAAVLDPKCANCSLRPVCQPQSKTNDGSRFLKGLFET